MRLPNYVDVKGVRYKIKQTKAKEHLMFNGLPAKGLFNPETRTIHILGSLSDTEKLHTYFHELFHAMLWELKLSQNDGWVDLLVEEIIVDNLSDMVSTEIRRIKK